MTRPKSNLIALLLAAVLLMPGFRALGGDISAQEYQLKAAWLYNLTRFVEWPETNFIATNAPFVIGIVGQDPFGSSLEEATRAENVHGHPIVIKHLTTNDALSSCQILFLSRSEQADFGPLVSQLAASPVLSVADADGASGQGVMVNLVVSRDTIKMEINQEAAKTAHLEISSRLLGLARIVKPSRQP